MRRSDQVVIESPAKELSVGDTHATATDQYPTRHEPSYKFKQQHSNGAIEKNHVAVSDAGDFIHPSRQPIRGTKIISGYISYVAFLPCFR